MVSHESYYKPASFANKKDNEWWLDCEETTGTTILAFEIQDAVIVAADTRTTTGSYVANRYTDKLTKVSDYIYCCRSGSAADTQAISDIVSYNLDFHKIELGQAPLVETAATLFREMCYNYRNSLTAGIIVAGWDARKGPQVYSVPIGGMMARQPITIGGSGSTYLYGYCDENFKANMTKQEGIDFAKMIINLATERDGSSGGCCRVGVISKDGIERLTFLPDSFKKHTL